jgi:hypothetical protein
MKSIFLSVNYPSLCPDPLRVPTTRRGWEKTGEAEEEQQEVLTTFMLFLARIDLLIKSASRVCRSITVINRTGKLYASWQLKTSLDLENLQRISETYRHHNNNIFHKCISQSVSQSQRMCLWEIDTSAPPCVNSAWLMSLQQQQRVVFKATHCKQQTVQQSVQDRAQVSADEIEERWDLKLKSVIYTYILRPSRLYRFVELALNKTPCYTFFCFLNLYMYVKIFNTWFQHINRLQDTPRTKIVS